MSTPEHVIGWVVNGDVEYLGCRSCPPGECDVMAALHASNNALRAIFRVGSLDGNWPVCAEAYEIVGEVLYPDR